MTDILHTSNVNTDSTASHPTEQFSVDNALEDAPMPPEAFVLPNGAADPADGRLTASSFVTISDSQSTHASRQASARPVRKLINKPYLGGFRHKRSGILFLHASTQTMTAVEKRSLLSGPKFHRDTQTRFVRNRVLQTFRENGSQMDTKGLFLSTNHDHELTARPYETAAQHLAKKTHAVIVLQCFFRKCKAITILRHLRKLKDAKKAAEQQRRQKHKEMLEKQRQHHHERLKHPKSSKDFGLLFNGLESWRQQETERINATEPDPEARSEKLETLVNQEAALIQQIETLKVEAHSEAKQRKIHRWIEMMAGPKKWPLAEGGFALVETQATLKARDFRDMYYVLAKTAESVDERLHILLQVKNTVKEHDCDISRNLIQLINREGDLLCRGRDGSGLDGLRQRIVSLFLQFISVPQFNPEAGTMPMPSTKYQKGIVNNSPSTSIYMCKSCQRILPSACFHLSTTSTSIGVCATCQEQRNVGSTRKCADEYIRILALVRMTEAAITDTKMLGRFAVSNEKMEGLPAKPREPESSGKDAEASTQEQSVLISHFMTEDDVAHLVEVVWSGRSAISGLQTLSNLMLVRWNSLEPLSPWNNILITTEEAQMHTTTDITKLYAPEFRAKIMGRLNMARKKWANLYRIQRELEAKPVLISRLQFDPEKQALIVPSLDVTVGSMVDAGSDMPLFHSELA